MEDFLTKEDYEVAKEHGISYHTAYQRFYEYGFSKEKSITYVAPKPLWSEWKELAEAKDVSYQMFQRRIREGMAPGEAVEMGRVTGGRKKTNGDTNCVMRKVTDLSNIIKQKVSVARKTYDCDDCGKPILNGHKYISMFGSAFKGEKPYSLRICWKCDHDKHIQTAR